MQRKQEREGINLGGETILYEVRLERPEMSKLRVKWRLVEKTLILHWNNTHTDNDIDDQCIHLTIAVYFRHVICSYHHV